MNLNKSNTTERDEITSDDAVQYVVCGTNTSLMFLLIKTESVLACPILFLRGCMDISTK